MDLPPKNFIKRHITLTPDQKKVYEQMKKAAIAVLNGKVTTTMTVLTQLMRLHQITCGYVTADDGTTQQVESNRLNELMSILEETEGKVIIWANYQMSVSEIMQALTKKYGANSFVHYYGLTPQEDRQDYIRKFQNDPECRFLIA